MKIIQFCIPAISMVPVMLVACLFGCGKQNNLKNPPGPPPPAGLGISAVNPTQGSYNAQVIISGAGFSATASQDSVFFNGKAAVIVSASDSQLVVTVPVQAGTGNVDVKINGKTAQGPVFSYIWTVDAYVYAGGGQQFTEVDGPAASAGFWSPSGLALDDKGDLFVFDAGTFRTRMITPGTVVNGLVMGGTVSTYTKMNYEGGIPVTAPAVSTTMIWQNGVLYVNGFAFPNAGTYNFNQQMQPPDNISASGIASVFPGWGEMFGLFLDKSGNIYTCPAGPQYNAVAVVYKSGPPSWETIGSNTSGDVNGTWMLNVQNQPVPADEPSFDLPTGIVMDSKGNIFVCDAGNHNIREISPQGVITTFAGSGQAGNADGKGLSATFNFPECMAIDSSDNMYLMDIEPAPSLRKITPAGVVSTLTALPSPATGLTVDPSGLNFFISDWAGAIVKVVLQ